ncbi:unnamed protein product [Rotaria sp. Silwood1]|nr:unnamed protein product [Rotaria sp. Silwood1]CAF1587850.1 unnamed protein product [Rotaria sp. Silwood1]CAF3675351.1 unnamed protein product [Rotaria sp. Silwood1]CAF3713312.1 unnamed protein product [Rotaria sp. Silwood1]
MRAIRLLRILKLYLVFKQLKVLRALSTTLKESLIDFTGTLFGLVVVAFLFGAAAYVAETQANPEMFDSIPKATYWGIITITTVGYGDMYPITVIGRTIACLCALSGAAIIGMLVSVLVDRYQRVFNRKMHSSDQQMLSNEFTDMDNEYEDEEKKIIKEISSNRQLIREQLVEKMPQSNCRKNFDQEKSRKSSVRSKLNFSISVNDNTIDDQLVNQIIRNLNEKFIELQRTINKDIHLQIIDDDEKMLIQSSTCALFGSVSSVTKNINEVDDTVNLTLRSSL